VRTRAILTAATLAASAALIPTTTAQAAVAPAPVTPSFAVDRANSALRSNAAAFVAGAADTFRTRNVVIDADGSSHVRLDRMYRGLPVIGGDSIAHLKRDGALRAVTRTQASVLNLGVTPTVTADAAVAVAGGKAATKPALAVDARPATPILVWKLAVGADEEMRHVLVDARTGKVTDSWAELQTAEGTGHGHHVGEVPLDTTQNGSTFELRDPQRGGTYTVDMNNRQVGRGTLVTDADNTWGTGELSDRQTLAVDAQYGVAETWDYYLEKFGRQGIADDGKGSFNKVHYGRNYGNAGWSDSCFCMIYGDGDGVNLGPLTTLDVAGHEMTHGVTSRTAGLVYSGESGGLNESMSDIFGTLVEFHANNAEDPADYLVGEKVMLQLPALRYMDDPAKDGASASCWSSRVGRLDVHYSSGVGNHAFFLLAVGSGTHTFGGVEHNSPTCNGSTVTGIGNDKAGAIFYKALTSYMTSNTNYAGARTATLNAATDLYGADSAEYNAVAAAWSAVNVG
jgi:Zn-dependent metalloprotease